MKSISNQIIETYKRHLKLGLNLGSEGNISVKKLNLLHYK